ncbi:DUF2141 domain-containing protein [Pirellulaceae bacterium SH449]
MHYLDVFHLSWIESRRTLLSLGMLIGFSLMGCEAQRDATIRNDSDSSNQASMQKNLDESYGIDDSYGTSGREQLHTGEGPSGDGELTQEKLVIELIPQGFEIGGGPLRVAVYDGPKTFNKVEMALWKDVFEAEGMPITIELSRSQFAGNDLAIAIYQDSNSNEKLDKNTFGIPQELYGFSNNPKRGFGPPKYAEVAVPLESERLTLTISLH